MFNLIVLAYIIFVVLYACCLYIYENFIYQHIVTRTIKKNITEDWSLISISFPCSKKLSISAAFRANKNMRTPICINKGHLMYIHFKYKKGKVILDEWCKNFTQKVNLGLFKQEWDNKSN
jgi:hypothetical protein